VKRRAERARLRRPLLLTEELEQVRGRGALTSLLQVGGCHPEEPALLGIDAVNLFGPHAELVEKKPPRFSVASLHREHQRLVSQRAEAAEAYRLSCCGPLAAAAPGRLAHALTLGFRYLLYSMSEPHVAVALRIAGALFPTMCDTIGPARSAHPTRLALP
jgi:hypothetical protein